MRLISFFERFVFAGLMCFIVPTAVAQVITDDFSSKVGQELFLQSKHNDPYWHLAAHYTTQKNQTYCSVASSVMILNALHIKPDDSMFDKYDYFNQENFFSEAVLKKVTPELINKQGLTLDELADALRSYPVTVRSVHGSNDNYKKFITDISLALNNGHFVIGNFSRKAIKQKGGGHFSPIAAYNKTENKVLVLDVARYKHSAFWVDAEQFWQAMNTLDTTSKENRGYLIIEGK